MSAPKTGDFAPEVIPSPLEGRLEPEARPMSTPLEAALISAAVSLKRIADTLDVMRVLQANPRGVRLDADDLHAMRTRSR